MTNHSVGDVVKWNGFLVKIEQVEKTSEPVRYYVIFPSGRGRWVEAGEVRPANKELDNG